MTVKSIGIDIQQIRDRVRATTVRPTKDFNAFLGAADAMSGTAMTATQMYGPSGMAPAVIAAAFSGTAQLNQYSQQMSQISAPSFAGGSAFGAMGSTGGMGAMKYSGMPPGMTGAGGGSSVIPGTDNFSQADMINTMNQNNLQLLELQAMMQSNMQAWNTKSNILSADHRARMAMIEKFTTR